MNAPVTITATVPVWLTTGHNIETLLRYVREGKYPSAVREMYFYPGDMSRGSNPWTLIGEADITVRLQSRDEMVANQIKTLQAELNAERAAWLTKQKEILERINKLQAIDYTPAAECEATPEPVVGIDDDDLPF